ncbi:MAG TPA: hypothetical protein HA232_00020 [Methanocellales archaeon]|nr:hypothetical protein [Methanocellales archaeon]
MVEDESNEDVIEEESDEDLEEFIEKFKKEVIRLEKELSPLMNEKVTKEKIGIFL